MCKCERRKKMAGQACPTGPFDFSSRFRETAIKIERNSLASERAAVRASRCFSFALLTSLRENNNLIAPRRAVCLFARIHTGGERTRGQPTCLSGYHYAQPNYRPMVSWNAVRNPIDEMSTRLPPIHRRIKRPVLLAVGRRNIYIFNIKDLS